MNTLKAIMRTRPGLKNTRGLRVHIDDGTGKPLCGERMGDRHTVTRTKDAEGKITVTLTPSADVRQWQECLLELIDCRACLRSAILKAKAPKVEPVADPVADPESPVFGKKPPIEPAPEWLVNRMETATNMPPPSTEEVATQLAASAKVTSDLNEEEEYQKFIEETAKACKCQDGPCDSCLAGGVCDGPDEPMPEWLQEEAEEEEDNQPSVV